MEDPATREVGDDGRYRGRDLMNTQKRLLFRRIMDMVAQEQGELAYLLDCKGKNSEEYHGHEKALHRARAWENDPEKEKMLEDKMKVIDKVQGEILLALQPLFAEKFDQAAHEIPPGREYNEDLRHYVRFDFIFWERDIPWPGGGSREHYRFEQRYQQSEEAYQKRLQKLAERRKKENEKIRLPLDHRLITEKNYERYAKRIAKYMERYFAGYSNMLDVDNKDTALSEKLLEKYFLYFLIRALIETKIIFDIKSTRGGKSLDNTIFYISRYFEDKLGQRILFNPTKIKKKLRSNLNNNDAPMDLAYRNCMLEDVEDRESYLDTTYFKPKWTSCNKLRDVIMQEYDSQEGLREMSFKLINPLYHIYKDKEDTYTKELEIVTEHQKKKDDQDPRIHEIIEDIKQKLSYAQQQKKAHTVFEEDKQKIKPRYEISLTQIKNKHLKRYQVPVQYRHVFGITMNKNNNFYQIKAWLMHKADRANNNLVHQMTTAEYSDDKVMYLLRNYITNKDIEKIFVQKRWAKRSQRKEDIANYVKGIKEMSTKPKEISIQPQGKKRKKQKTIPREQLSFDF